MQPITYLANITTYFSMYYRHKLGNPIFMAAVATLVLNDWYLKHTFSNSFTGKLSDFAGLFALAFLLSGLFPTKAWVMHTGTAILFVIWKSPAIQPVIDHLNACGLPFNRVVDYTDNMALSILPISYFAFKRAGLYAIRPLVLQSLILFSCFAFVGTSMPPGKYTQFNDVNKTYRFSFPKRELVSRVNALQMEYVNDLNKSIHYSNRLHDGPLNTDSLRLDFDSKTNNFYYSSSQNNSKRDTIAHIIDYETVKDTDIIPLKTSYANISLSGNAKTSALTVIRLNGFVRKSEKGNPQAKALQIFEKLVVKKLESYSR